MKFIDIRPTCDDTALLLSRGLDGDLPGAEAALLYAHIAACDTCRHAMGELAALDLALRQLERALVGAGLDKGFAGELELSCKLDAGRSESGVAQLRRFVRHAADDAVLRDKL